MRGKVFRFFRVLQFLRITPAYAGKSLDMLGTGCQNRDHPRLCGEKYTLKFKPRQNRGSPPPMRGKVLQENGSVYEIRITPAYAGKR